MSGASTPQILTPDISVEAGADLSASQYCFVNLNSSGQVVLPSAGGRVIGVLTNDPAAQGRAAEVQVTGIAKVVLGGTVTEGDDVKSDAAGNAVTASAGDLSVGVCVKGGASGEWGLVLLGPNNFASGGDLEIVTSGAISVVKRTTLLSIDGTKAFTLGSGLYGGQRKTIQASTATNIPAGQITGAFLDTDGTTARTTADFNAVADALELEWKASASKWQVLVKTSVTMG